MGKSKRKNKNGYHQIEDDSSNPKRQGGKQKNGQKGENQGNNGNQNNNSKNKKKLKSKYLQSDDDFSFRQKLENNGEREIIEMACDGNCLFRSISHQLYNDHGQKHEEVRQEICDYLAQNEDDFKVYLLLDDSDDNDDVCDFNKYIDEMRKDGKWGGDVEIVCAARLYKRTVTIFTHVGAYNISVDTEEEKSRPNMLLSYHDNRHYNSVHDQANNGHDKTNQDAPNQSGSGSKNNGQRKETRKKKQNGNYHSDETKTNNVIDYNDGSKDGVQSLQEQKLRTDVAKEELKKKNVLRKNDICRCGSGLRYKKCCLAKEKHRIRLEKFREKHGINVEDEEKISDGYTESVGLDSGFAVLNI